MFSARIIIAAAAAIIFTAKAIEVEHLSSVAQDSNDYFYLPSHEGLLKYDGQHLLNLSQYSDLPQDLARDIEISKRDIAFVLYNSGEIWKVNLKNLSAEKFADSEAMNIELNQDSLILQEESRVLEYDIQSKKIAVLLAGKDRIFDLSAGFGNVYVLANDGLYRIANKQSQIVLNENVRAGNLEVTPHGVAYFANEYLAYYTHLHDRVVKNSDIKSAENLTYVSPYFIYFTDGNKVNEALLSTLEVTRTNINSDKNTYISLFADSSQRLWGVNINEFAIVEGNTRITSLDFGSEYNVIERVDSEWWIGTTKGVYIYDKPAKWLNDQLIGDERAFFEVTAIKHFGGKVIVMGDSGAFIVDIENKSVNRLYEGYVINASIIGKNLYLATDKEGLISFNENFVLDDLSTINAVLPSREIINVKQIEDKLYISTSAGLISTNPNNYAKYEYLSDAKATDISKLQDTLYLATYGDGLLKKVGSDWHKVPSPKYIKELVEHQDELLLLTSNGIHSIGPNKDTTKLIHETRTHSFMIGGVKLFGNKLIAVSDRALIELNPVQDYSITPPQVSFVKSKQGLHIDKGEVEIAVDDWLNIAVTSLGYFEVADINYEYRLNSGDWVQLASPMIQLNNLAPNAYQLDIRQKIGNLVSDNAEYKFYVRSHWYSSPTAMVAYFVIILLITIAIVIYGYCWVESFHRVYRKNQIKYQSDKLSQAVFSLEQVKVLCGGDDTMLTEGLVKLEAITKALEPMAHCNASLGEQRLGSGLDMLQLQTTLQAKIMTKFEVTIGKERLAEQLEKDIYSVVYHAVQNAIAYSHGTLVKVNVHKLRENIEVVVEDDGTGIPFKSRLHFGAGFYTMRQIAKAYKTKLKIKTGRNGTCILMNFPLIEAKSKKPVNQQVASF
ncbi:ATP-binding protein [Pseudoalteromonas piscicida]|uniref:ATP-binding protein n=1 Tax=Pseudoalteromonas piscicida TaxID=43662 RepID=UPI0030C961F6